MSLCRECGDEIFFAKLKSGGTIPVDSLEPEEYKIHTTRPQVGPKDLIKRQRLLIDGVIVSVYHVIREGKRLEPGPCTVQALDIHEDVN